LPYVNLGWTIVLSILIGIILSSAFPAILVYAQELVPGKVGLITGLFFGCGFWNRRHWICLERLFSSRWTYCSLQEYAFVCL
jgi:hypothetical protein